MSDFIQQQALILASASQSRFKLLTSLGLNFAVIPANCDEDNIKRNSAYSGSFPELAQELARCKALEVSQEHPDSFVIGADQLCVIGNQYLDKPVSHDMAIKQLHLLRGRKHQQISAFSIAKAGKILWQAHDIAELGMLALDDEFIESYLQTAKPYQSCGAYHYEGLGKWLFKDVCGKDCTIQGLPLLLLAQALVELQIVKFSSYKI